eukprot:TRINITY_DN76754_c0_g1_i1.p1 TRINITY_DN76754_c0_g1~~TRINITY_DN76754_c0_g1_i1.p1  ORF type:complete len:255 (-),score=30.99 TRINITY_DN76754_c0_g1_i1:90-854(-)
MAGGNARSCTSQTLPSVSSAYPMRRAASLSSANRESAEKCWQSTLRDRLGSPGKPPGADTLPSLHDPKRVRRPASGMSRSAPPSTVGPSASIVAWFAQFQCDLCGKIPMALDAKFCSSCGQSLSSPVPAASALAALGGGGSGGNAGGGGGTSPSQVGAEAVAGARAEAAAMPRSRSVSGLRGPDAAADAPSADRRSACRKQMPGAPPRKPDVPAARPPRPPTGSPPPGTGKPLSYGARESQVAVWLGNIRPRQP